MQAEVLNVSSGGMQLFIHDELKSGDAAGIQGAKTERLALLRYCSAAPGGYHLGLQFFCDHHSPER